MGNLFERINPKKQLVVGVFVASIMVLTILFLLCGNSGDEKTSYIVTSTPISKKMLRTTNVDEVVISQYSLNRACITDVLHPHGEVFSEVKLQIDSISSTSLTDNLKIFEMAESENKKFRSYIGCNNESCQDEIFYVDIDKGKLYHLDWSGRIPWRPIRDLFWIGDEYLVFTHNTGIQNVTIGVVDVSTKTLISYWLYRSDCDNKEPTQ